MHKHLLCTAFDIKLTTGSGNAGTCEKLHDRNRIRLRQKAGVCASALRVRNCHPVKCRYQCMKLHGVITQHGGKKSILFIPRIIVQFPQFQSTNSHNWQRKLREFLGRNCGHRIFTLTLWRRNYFFLILAHLVYKM